ncbi:hypothetical protein F5148DRAFT_503710 [Russula earlei]|uniref:Uncharacterized protein n=1 Tax=Russula earlei TaxID=71964 RepID=A0ACC0TY55_9AGAM|nr:hypothetical protein F5148DRAFT_503710 [Russula earlei]
MMCPVCFIESDPRAQASLQPALGDVMSGEELGDVIDDDDAHARVVHEGAAEARQHSESDGGERATMAAIPSGALQGQYATSDFGATRGYTRDDPLAPELSVDDISDNEMAPPRVTRPLPPAPAPAVNPDQAAPVAPTPPVIPKRTSLPAPTRAVPVPSSDTPPPIQGPSPQRAPARRTSLLPPSREIPIPVPDILDVASPRHQSSTKRTSLPPPTLLAPSSSFSREGSVPSSSPSAPTCSRLLRIRTPGAWAEQRGASRSR